MNRLEPPVPPPQAELPSGAFALTPWEWAAWGAAGCSLGFTLLAGIRPACPSIEIWVWPLGWILFGMLGAGGSFKGPKIAHHSVGVMTLFLPWLQPFPFGSTSLLGWGQNQMAGALVLFLPFWWISARGSHGRLARYFFTALSLCTLVRLWQLQSRGAWLGTASAILILWGLTSGIEPGRLKAVAIKTASALLLATLLLPSTAQRSIEGLVLEGQLKGPSLETALTGRPAIWWRSLVAWSDLPLGVGLGASKQVLAELYPGAIPDPGHAHQQWLQLGLELGWIGLSSWLLLLIVCIRPLWRSVKQHRLTSTLLHPGQAATIAAWLGWIVFGLADCLPPAEFSSFGLWTLLAWTAASSRTELSEPDPDGAVERSGVTRSALLLLTATLLSLSSIPEDLDHRRAFQVLFENPSPEDRKIAESLISPSSSDGDLWLAALLAQRTESYRLSENRLSENRLSENRLSENRLSKNRLSENRLSENRLGRDLLSEKAWRRLIEHTGSRVSLLRYQRFKEAPAELADYAVSLHPEQCHAWWWRAEIRQTVPSWQEGLARCPRNGEAWLKLADLLRRSGSTEELSSALDAYERACQLGDPGANACWRGGHLARQLGQSQRAARLYLRSRLPQARDQAYALTTLGSDSR